MEASLQNMRLKAWKELDKNGPGKKVVIALRPNSPKNIGILATSGTVRYLLNHQYEVRKIQLKYLDKRGVSYNII